MNNTNIFIKKMFDTIAPKYDFLNRLLSLGQDIYWRKIIAASVGSAKNLLDAACGTGDVAFEITKQHKKIKIYGTDFSEEMLLIAQKKKDITDCKNLFFVAADALLLPFANNCFDAVTIAFGIRNIENKKRVLTEFIRVLKLIIIGNHGQHLRSIGNYILIVKQIMEQDVINVIQTI